MSLESIEFAVLTPEEVRSISVLQVTETDIYDDHGAIKGGLRDTRMGPTAIGQNNICQVCDLSVAKCGGHFGCIEFPLHLYHINRIQEVISILKTRCRKCFKTTKKNKVCEHCGNPPPKIMWDSKRNIVLVDGEETFAHDIVQWLGDKSVLLMKNMLVPPNAVRPPPTVGDEEIMGEDVTTRGLLQITRTLKALKSRMASKDPQTVLNFTVANLQKHVNIYIDRQRSTKTRGGQSLADRLRGKRGRLRGNTMGKRCNYTARTVVTGDSMLGMREVGVPESIANNVTKKVTVNNINIKHLNNLLTKGKIKTVYRGDRMFDLTHKRGRTQLEVGDKVDRALEDGDYVLFNRQPSLHRPSIMAHRVRVMPWSTFRLNLSCTTPYNADFDGDEMNLHSLQSVEAEAEMLELMSVEKNFITAASHRPVMSIVQDTLIALYEITHPDYYFDFEAMCQWFYVAGIKGEPPKERRKYKGTEVVSLSFPNDLNYKRGDFEIRQGKIVSGRINKKIMGRSDGSLVHAIVLDYGGSTMCDIIDTLQRGVAQYSYTMGFSIGVKDMIPKRETTSAIQKACDEAYAAISPEDSETEINMKLNSARDTMGKLAIKETAKDNSLRRIVESGTKGSLVNIMQVTALVGQQNCGGARIKQTVSGRTLPCFAKGDVGGRARGFVRSPYITGLTPDEYFFHAIGGREGLVDTAIKTSQTGYIQRRLCKAMESLVVAHDMTVRDSKGNLIQLTYGEDGFDPVKIENDGGETPVQVPMRRILRKHAMTPRNKGERLYKKHRAPTFDNEKLNKYIEDVVEQAPAMTRRAFKNACNEAQRKWETSKVQPGESVGVLAAQSIGEPVTQMTLNTFHSAGNSASNVTLGVPRFESLINASSSSKIKRNFFKCESKKKAFALLNIVRETKVHHLVTLAYIESTHEKQGLQTYREFPDYPIYQKRTNHNMVTLIVGKKELAQRNINMETLVQHIRTFSKRKVEVHWTAPINEDNIIVAMFKNIHMKKSEVRTWLHNCLNHTLQGVKNMRNAIITKGGIETEGSNLMETMLIDKNVYSDDVWDVYNCLGVEAARETLFREIVRVLTANGAYVSSRHISLLCDWMTHEGGIRGTTRHGQKSSGPLARASYEQPVEILQQAAMQGKRDKLEGVSEQLMFGKRPIIGGELCEMITEVKTEDKVKPNTWDGNFQFFKPKKRKRVPEPLKRTVRKEPSVESIFTQHTSNGGWNQPQAPAHPWMTAQAW